MALRKLAIASALVLTAFAAAPAKASADWLFTPFIGMNWGGTAGFTIERDDFEDEFEQKMNFGAQLSWMGAGALGFEVDFGYSPNFFENTAGDNDFAVRRQQRHDADGQPEGRRAVRRPERRRHPSLRLGRHRHHQDRGSTTPTICSKWTAPDWGLNVGGGVAGFFSDNFGLQGDVRYFRSLQDTEADGESDFNVGARFVQLLARNRRARLPVLERTDRTDPDGVPDLKNGATEITK